VSDILADLAPARPLSPGRYGAARGAPAVKAVRLDLALATLGAGRDASALSQAVEAACGATLPQGPRVATGGAFSFIGIGPGRWTVTAEGTSGEALLAKLEAAVGTNGSACDQSDGSVVYELSGAKAREALMKMLDIDIDPAVFKTGSAAVTRAALIGVTFWQTSEAPVYRFLVARSYDLAFLRALAESAAEYGFELV
jgi:heterotetrameric sarcosine oxidase gamma subunit